MEEYNLHIYDLRQYKADVKVIRDNRKNIKLEDKIIIHVWPCAEKKLEVVAKGPNLWILGFMDKDNELKPFRSNDKYKDNDKAGALICVEQICAFAVSFIDQMKEGTLTEGARENGFLIFTFLASEMVRNEIMEVIYFCKDPNPSWAELVPFFKNWESASRLLYPGSDEAFIEHIMVDKYDEYRQLKLWRPKSEILYLLEKIEPYVKKYSQIT